MSILLYPSKRAPRGWRVQDCIFHENYYFPVSKYGSLARAKQAAIKVESRLQERRRLRALRLQLDINQLFYPDGAVIGLQRTTKNIRGKAVPLLIAQVTVNGKQVKTDRRLANRPFHEPYTSIQDWILEKRGLTRTREITQAFEACAYLYR
ncbi:hypothetical protein NMS23_003558 [Vibrio parahaemolyticus]|nr:hypothetical protein [Vibrio parahaemolyticus]